ncbi:MAG: ATP-grasp domain-containing protein [Phycisphaerae bacterium]|nr:ATP-grasp domain-containing protein [Phycisphaerae bacterium]
MENILILHNTYGSPEDSLYESRAGVMDQVRAVQQALDMLNLASEVLAVENLRHLTQILGSRREHIIFNLVEEFLCDIEQACYVPAVSRALGKYCTGNDTPALLLSQNKIYTKALLRDAGLPSPEGIVLSGREATDWRSLPAGWYIFKPAFCDASEGITSASVLSLPDEKKKAEALLQRLYEQFSQPVIVEQFIPGRELNVSVIQRNRKIKVLPLAEIDFTAFSDSQTKIVDHDAKWQKDSFGYNNTPRKIPADLPDHVSVRVESLAAAAFKSLNCQDYARVDFRLDEELNPFILEVNPNPDISEDAGFAAALQAADIPYERFIWTVITNTQDRLSAAQYTAQANTKWTPIC